MNATAGVLSVIGVSLATLVIGLFGLRISRTTSDFYVASRSVGPVVNASAIGGEYLSAASFLGVAGLVLAHGPSAVVYAVCDSVVDRYEEVAQSLVEDVDEVETSVFSAGRTKDAERIYVLKRELAEMRRAVLPLRDPVRRFAAGSVTGMDPASGPYFRDVADHLDRVADTIDVLDGLLSTAFDAHLAQISIQQNDDMRKISAWVAIAAIPTMVAGLYGMNVPLPGRDDWWSYIVICVILLIACAYLYRAFRKNGWL